MQSFHAIIDYIPLHLFKNCILLSMLLQLSQIFPPCPPPSGPLTPSGNPHTVVHVYGSCICVLLVLYFLCCTPHPHGYSVTTNLHFLKSSIFTHHPRDPASNLKTIKISAYMILFLFSLFVCFLD